MQEINPQLENGYIKIANEIVDALIKTRIPGECMQVLLLILRQTYGYNRKNDNIALNRFCLMTGINKPSVCRAINKLIKINIIKKDNDLYSFQKDYSIWKPLSKKIMIIKKDNNHYLKSKSALSKKIISIIQKDNDYISKYITKDNTKDNIKNKGESFCSTFNSFLEIRHKKGVKHTDHAIDLILNKLENSAKDNIPLQIKMIEQSIMCGWTGVFEVKQSFNKPEPKQTTEVYTNGERID